MNSFAEVFDKALEYIHQMVRDNKLSQVAYETWITKMTPVKLEGNTAYLSVQSEFQKSISKNYESHLKEAFLNVLGFDVEINIIVEKDSEAVSDRSEESLKQTLSNSEYDYTFDTFIVGRSNEFAHAACVAVAQRRGSAYNPLFIHGPSGLGKTHLLTAIQNSIRASDPTTNIVYVTGEVFTHELITAIQKNDTLPFRNKYRNADILLVDDVHFISGKESTQEEFFHTFNELHQQGKQIVLTSDRPPKDIKTLEERIRTRFEWGLIADITTPDFETRVAIIRRKADLLNLDLSDDVIECIANRLKSNIRQLEGCVNKLKAAQHLVGTPPTMQQALNAIREILSDDQPEPVTIERIINNVASVYNVTPDEIRSSKRTSSISNARQVAAYIIKDMTELSLKEVGAELGGRDHSTVTFYIKTINDQMRNDPKVKETIEDIIKNIRAG